MHSHGVFIQIKTKTVGRYSEFDQEECQELAEMEGIYLAIKKRHKYADGELQPFSFDVLKQIGTDAYIVQRREIKHFFLIMDRLGDPLRKIHDKHNNYFTYKTTAQIGI